MFSTSESTEIHPRLDPLPEADAALGTLSAALSRALWTPREMTGAELNTLRTIPADALGATRSAVDDLAGDWELALADRKALSIAYARLFLGPFEIQAPPYASFYLEPDHRIMGYVSNHVAQLYAEAGLEPGPGPREVPDHAAIEWEFVYFLTHQYLSTGEPIWLDRRASFVRDHLALWMPEFCTAITQASIHPFYDAWAACVIAALPHFVDRGS